MVGNHRYRHQDIADASHDHGITADERNWTDDQRQKSAVNEALGYQVSLSSMKRIGRSQIRRATQPPGLLTLWREPFGLTTKLPEL